MRAHGTWQKGERNGHARLTEKDVRQIREMANYHSRRYIREKFGISQTQLHEIIHRRKWAHLD
jgi:hypothetical protein